MAFQWPGGVSEVGPSARLRQQFDQNQHGKAEPMHKRALAIREESFGLDHLLVAESLNDLVALYRATNREEEAEILEQRAAQISKEQVQQ